MTRYVKVRRSRNQTQLQRLKPTERNFASAGLKSLRENLVLVYVAPAFRRACA